MYDSKFLYYIMEGMELGKCQISNVYTTINVSYLKISNYNWEISLLKYLCSVHPCQISNQCNNLCEKVKHGNNFGLFLVSFVLYNFIFIGWYGDLVTTWKLDKKINVRMKYIFFYLLFTISSSTFVNASIFVVSINRMNCSKFY